MALEEYRRKRDFRITSEPAGTAARRARRKRIFVIQKHAATRLHYDLRLELDGVLKSWAVPKGPSLDPQEKRLAVQVEDHPLDYAKFEGSIPAGEYGAGDVIVWDRGTWEPLDDPRQGLSAGKLDFELHGEKLTGRWTLIRTRSGAAGKPNWLLLKRRDDQALPQSEYDITLQRPESVKTGRELDADGKLTTVPKQRAKARKRTPHYPARKSAKKTLATKKLATKKLATRKLARRKLPTRKSKKRPGTRQKKRAEFQPMAAQSRRVSRQRAAIVSPKAISGARPAALPQAIDLQLATLAPAAPLGDEWLHEIKYDGYRVLCRLDAGKVKLLTRRQQDWTHRYPTLALAAAELPANAALIDGEVCAVLPNGISSFQALQNSDRSSEQSQIVYYAFDLLHLNGYDLRAAVLAKRKELLRELLTQAQVKAIQFSDHFDVAGPSLLKESCRLGLEGIISKRRDRPYVSGRTTEWLKSKCLGREELVIGGFTLSEADIRGVGALLVGYFDGGSLHYAGRVGTGFSAKALIELRQRLERVKQAKCPFDSVPSKERGPLVQWVQPRLVAEVAFTGWTDAGVLRHPSFQGLREDKIASDVTRPPSLAKAQELSMPTSTSRQSKPASSRQKVKGQSKPKPPSEAKKSSRAKGKPAITLPADLQVELTSPDRVLWPDIGLTKLGLAAFYARIASWIVPHLIDRPLSMVRCPDGQTAKCFYQKHSMPGTPPALARVPVQESDGVEEYLAVRDLAGLMGLVQTSILEIHPWGSRRDRLDHPDRLIFDLDPDEGLAWQRVIDAALETRDLLEELGLVSFVKTTGGKGLHVVVPLSPRRHPWDAAKAFARRVAEQLVARRPAAYVATMSKAQRRGKVFIDFFRNDYGSTAVAPYSTRAKPGAPVSTPLFWDELSQKLKSDHFTVENLPNRLEQLKSDPWEGIDDVKQSLPKKI